MVDKKSWNQIGWEHFGLYLRNKNFHRHFNYRKNFVKINDQIFQWIQKTLFLVHFWSFFHILGEKNWLLVPHQNLEKTNHTIPSKHPGRWKDGWRDSTMNRPYFKGPLWLPLWVQIRKKLPVILEECKYIMKEKMMI